MQNEIIVIATTDGDFFQGEFVTFARKVFTNENKFWDDRVVVQLYSRR